MPMRLSGLMSGMDTESIIKDLVAVKRAKVDDAKKAQTKLKWKQDAWKDLNTKLYKLYNGTLGNLRFYDSFSKKTTNVSNPNKVSVITGEGAMNSVQGLKIEQLAKSGYLTGGELSSVAAYDSELTADSKVTEALGIAAGSSFEIGTGGERTVIEINEDTKISDVVQQLRDAGVSANFDEQNKRFYIAAKTTGKDADFSLTAVNGSGEDALNKLGIQFLDEKTIAEYVRYAAMGSDPDAKQAELDAQIAARLAPYTTKLNGLKKTMEDSAKKLLDDYGMDITLLTPDDLVIAREAAENRITELEGQTSLTDAEKAELTKNKEIVKYAKSKNDIADMSGYITEDGSAGATLISEATAELDSKIAQGIRYQNGEIRNSDGTHRIQGQDAKISLNDTTYENSTNTFEINGLTITCSAETEPGEEITLTTQDDTTGIYDMVKTFITEYSALINEMDKLYNADSVRGYEPLTDEEKDAMSDKEVEKWEDKIKDSILRKDSTLGTVSQAMKFIMMEGVEVNGREMHLSDFGIETLGYFDAQENEHNAYHINGDKDDSAVGSKPNDLMAAIASDPETVTEFFVQLSRNLYGKVGDLMEGTEYSSSFTVYEDKKMKEDYDDYTAQIKDLEKRLQDYEDKWYAKFASMETALAKLQSNASAVTSLLGGG